MHQAREALKTRWGLAIGTCLVYMLIVGGFGSVKYMGGIVTLILTGPMQLGLATFSLSIVREKEASFQQLFDGFNDFSKALVTYLLMLLYVLLWTLLLIIPGIIAALSYSMTFYILADDSNLKPEQALMKSKEMMDGHKEKLFYLYLRFLLLSILCVLTLGIGFLWFIPFVNITLAEFYENLKASRTEPQEL
ncbi:MAG: DUF975 family protein [Bacteroidia bacterium]